MKKQITLRLNLKIYERLKRISEHLDISIHECIVVAINEFIQKNTQK